VAQYEAGEVDGGMSSTSSSRITSVINTMKNILASIQETERTEAGNYKCFMEWCASEIETTNTSLLGSQDDFEAETAQSTETSAEITNTAHEISKASDEIVEVKDTLAQTTNIRDKDREEYTEDSTMNTQSLRQINTAIQLIGQVHNQGGFLQKGVLKRVQLNEPGESKFVLGVMKGIKQKLEKTKTEQDSAEQVKEDQYNNLTAVKTAQLQSLQSDVAEKKTLHSEKRISLVESQNDAQDAQREITALQLHLDETLEQCAKKTREWKVRGKDRQAEKAALSEAIAYMEQTAQEDAAAPAAPPASLIAASTAVSDTAPASSDDAAPLSDEADDDTADGSDTDDSDESFLQVSHRLKQRVTAHALGSSMAFTLASTADAQLSALSVETPAEKKEGFAGAIKVVKDLLVVLQDQQKEEDQKRKYCEAEIETKDAEKTKTQEKLDMLTATINRKETMIQTFANEVVEMERENEAAKAAADEAKVLRDGEKSAYEKGTKDRTLAVKVIRQAKTVLAAFYESKERNSLAQMNVVHKKSSSSAPPPETWSSTSSQRESTSSGAVMLMLDKIAQDIEAEQKDAAKEEKTSARAYEKFNKESREEFDERAEEMTNRVTRKAKALVQVNNHREESSSLQDDHDAITVQLGDLHSECDALLQNHKQRSEARFHEISQLRDVIDILSGSSIAARTGDAAAASAAMIQQKPQMVQKPQRQQRQQQPVDDQLSELQDLSTSIDSLAVKARSLVQS